MQRRQFLQGVVQTGAAAVSLSAIAADEVPGANNRVRVALIGCGSRGGAVSRLMAEVPGVQFVAAVDVYDVNAGKAKEEFGSGCDTYRDFRKVLDRKDVDAVLIGTPDHWHAIPTVLACAAGKDVYVEKPLSHNIREGRAMVEAARKHNRIVQAGMQHRSSPHYREAAELVQSGKLGPIRFVRCWNYTNSYPSTPARQEDSVLPAELDWDMFLGPAPKVPYQRSRQNGFRAYFDYAGGFLTDFGTHRMDSMLQVMGVNAPLAVTAMGSRFELKNGDTPDILQVTYEFPSFVLSYECCQLNGHGTGARTPGKRYYRARGPDDRPHGEAFYGTNGTLLSDRIGYEVRPEWERERREDRRGFDVPGAEVPSGERPPAERQVEAPPAGDATPKGEAPREGGRRRRDGGKGQRRGGSLVERMPRQDVAAEDCTDLHVANFIDCVRSRERPVADVEIGHRSTTAVHLGNIALRTGRKIRWDAAKEQIIDDPEASKLLGRAARPPWDLI